MATASNTTIPTKIDRAAIMRAAHSYARDYAGRDWSYAKLLSWGLKFAWEEATSNQTKEEARAKSIRAELETLKFKSLRYDTVARQQELEAELHQIAA